MSIVFNGLLNYLAKKEPSARLPEIINLRNRPNKFRIFVYEVSFFVGKPVYLLI